MSWPPPEPWHESVQAGIVPVPGELPALVGPAWDCLDQEDGRVATALNTWHGALLACSNYPSMAYLACVAVLDALGQARWGLREIGHCTGAQARFAAVLAYSGTPEQLERIGPPRNAYSRRCLSAHEAVLHGGEDHPGTLVDLALTSPYALAEHDFTLSQLTALMGVARSALVSSLAV
jgi:hypothetical protein